MSAEREAEIVAREEALVAAMKASDVAALDDLIHDDLLFNAPHGVTATKQDDLDGYRSGNVHLRSIETSDRVVRFIGDDAVVAVTATIRGEYLGERIDGRYRYIRVWKPSDGRWRIIAGAVTRLAD